MDHWLEKWSIHLANQRMCVAYTIFTALLAFSNTSTFHLKKELRLRVLWAATTPHTAELEYSNCMRMERARVLEVLASLRLEC